MAEPIARGDRGRRTRSALALLASLALALLAAGCGPQPSAVDRLPELPAELAADLEASPSAALLISRPAMPEAPTLPEPLALRQKACTKNYFGPGVTYTVVLCTIPDVDFELPPSGGGGPQVSVQQPPPGVEYFKLSSLRGKRFGRTHVCVATTGPWNAAVKEMEACDTEIPNTFELTIQAVPDPILLGWSGTLGDAPPGVEGLESLQLVTTVCTCCGRFDTCPDGTCVPLGNPCTPPIQ